MFNKVEFNVFIGVCSYVVELYNVDMGIVVYVMFIYYVLFVIVMVFFNIIVVYILYVLERNLFLDVYD